MFWTEPSSVLERTPESTQTMITVAPERSEQHTPQWYDFGDNDMAVYYTPRLANANTEDVEFKWREHNAKVRGAKSWIGENIFRSGKMNHFWFSLFCLTVFSCYSVIRCSCRMGASQSSLTPEEVEELQDPEISGCMCLLLLMMCFMHERSSSVYWQAP